MSNKFDKPDRNLAQSVARRAAKRFGVVLAGMALAAFGLATAAERATDIAPAKTPATIPWSQLGTKATADYKGDELVVVQTTEGARLHCVFQRLEGEATREGMWLTSAASNTVNDRFRIVAANVRRFTSETVGTRSTASPLSRVESGTRWNASPPPTGTVSIDGQTVRFIRPGLIEEYTVSMDGVRQDFVLPERPEGASELVVSLAVSGASVELSRDGVQLTLRNSGRKIAYNRLRVTDATGRDLPARMEVGSAEDELATFDSTIQNQKSKIKNRSPLTSYERPATSMLAVIVDDTGAIYPLRIDPTFSDANWISMGGIPGASGPDTANGAVQAAVVDGLGNLYIGSDFTIVGDVFATNIAKWNGTNWSSLGSGMGGGGFYGTFVNALAVSGSNVYAGGYFTTAGGISAMNIAKWNGSTWSALGSGLNGAVGAMVVSGNDLYVGGGFTTAGGITAASIARWNGSSWSALGSGMNGYVRALAVSGNGDLYAGGDFTTAGGALATNIARWNGSSWSALGSGLDGINAGVFALAVSGNGDLYAGGDFTTAGGTLATNIAKWNGSSWSPLGSGMDSPVSALTASGNDLYVGGGFTTAGGIAVTGIAKWDESSWVALGLGLGSSDPQFPPDVHALAVSGSAVYAGGRFTTAGGSAANNIAKWTGNSWSGLGAGMGGFNPPEVVALAVSGSDTYAGGQFTTAGPSAANHIAKWNGTSWSALGLGMGGGPEYRMVWALAVSATDLYAGGWFATAGGSAATNIARWNGSSWSALGSGLGINAGNVGVYALAVSGSNLYAGGYFTTAGSIPVNGIAKWNGSWTALGSGIDGAVYALAVSGSDVYAGGYFTTAGGSTANCVAKWNGTIWSALGSGVNGGVNALAVSGSDLYAGGQFTTAGPSAANHIAKWNGSSWSALGSGINGPVLALAVSGSDVYAGGSFDTAGGIAATNIARWNGSSWSALGSGMNYQVKVLAVSRSTLYAGGDFTIAGGKVSAYVARAIVNPPILAIEPDLFSGYFINFSGVPGSAYRLQRAPTVKGPWSTSAPHTAPASGLVEFWDLFPPPGQGFYRTVQP